MRRGWESACAAAVLPFCCRQDGTLGISNLRNIVKVSIWLISCLWESTFCTNGLLFGFRQIHALFTLELNFLSISDDTC